MTKTNFIPNIGVPLDVANTLIRAIGWKYPVGRHGEAVDIANAILYLTSEQASFITGTNFVVDGGHLAANVNE